MRETAKPWYDVDKKTRSLGDDMHIWDRDVDEEMNLLVRSFEDFELDELE
jgi:hypothetical protein